jgi:monosaccharide-transporting ATPase
MKTRFRSSSPSCGKLKSRGVGIIFVTHFLDQVYEISDRITVLRNGEFIGEYEASELSQIDLVSKDDGEGAG